MVMNFISALGRARRRPLARAYQNLTCPSWVSAKASDLQSVSNWSAALLKVLDQHDPLKTVLSVSQDFLGVNAMRAHQFGIVAPVGRNGVEDCSMCCRSK